MKFKIRVIPAALLTTAALCVMLSNCKKSNDVLTLTSSTATYIGQRWALLNGTVMAANQTAIATFEYDTSTAYSYSMAASPDTITGTTLTLVSAAITGLKKNTTYHFRLKVTTPADTYYGTDLTFTTTNPGTSKISFNPSLSYGTLTDIDNNVYRTIQIGSQVWMAENLKTSKYNDGISIPYVPKSGSWSLLTTPGYCWYNTDSVAYGALYNWYAVNTGNLCPTGWHVPSDPEWYTLTNFLADSGNVAIPLREEADEHWAYSNIDATNSTGFSALAGGYVNVTGTSNNIKNYGYWWTSTPNMTVDAFSRDIYYCFTTLDRTSSLKRCGFSVRCVKDSFTTVFPQQ
jgi:uncharacterized protein (TIGR02145 family)